MVGRLRLLRFLINNKGSFAVGIKAEKRKSLRELPNDDERLSLHKISIFRQLPYKWYKINKKRIKNTLGAPNLSFLKQSILPQI